MADRDEASGVAPRGRLLLTTRNLHFELTGGPAAYGEGFGQRFQCIGIEPGDTGHRATVRKRAPDDDFIAGEAAHLVRTCPQGNANLSGKFCTAAPELYMPGLTAGREYHQILFIQKAEVPGL